MSSLVGESAQERRTPRCAGTRGGLPLQANRIAEMEGAHMLTCAGCPSPEPSAEPALVLGQTSIQRSSASTEYALRRNIANRNCARHPAPTLGPGSPEHLWHIAAVARCTRCCTAVARAASMAHRSQNPTTAMVASLPQGTRHQARATRHAPPGTRHQARTARHAPPGTHHVAPRHGQGAGKASAPRGTEVPRGALCVAWCVTR